MTDYPHHGMVPKELTRNLAFREDVLRWGSESRENAEELWAMCRDDMLFWWDTFLWTYDPRIPTCPVQPFITYPFQEEAVKRLRDSVERQYPVLIEKSRATGATYLMMGTGLYPWQFKDKVTVLVGSRNEAYVDNSEDEKALLWKFDFMLENQPAWLRPRMTRTHMKRVNDDNGSMMTGEASGPNFGRGARRTLVIQDEVAFDDNGRAANTSCSKTSRCRWMNSTPNGVGNVFYDQRSKPDIVKLRMHWSDHPVYRRGLYRWENGLVQRLDEWRGSVSLMRGGEYVKYKFPEEYPFDWAGRIFADQFPLRSPWFDEECIEATSRRDIAQELEISYHESGGAFFDLVELERLVVETGRKPVAVGELAYDTDHARPKRFDSRNYGRLSLWTALHPNSQNPPRTPGYVIGVDVATGTGASNSCVAVIDKRSGEKVAEWVDNNTRPEELAVVAVSMARWFRDMDGGEAYLGWEANGPGRNFGDRVQELGFHNFFYRLKEDKVYAERTLMPGWYSSYQSKRQLLADYQHAINKGHLIERSMPTLDEARQYVYDGKKIVFAAMKNREDADASEDNHGDRVIASALAWKLMRERPYSDDSASAEPPMYSYQWRMRRHDAKLEAQSRDNDPFLRKALANRY